jgi:hypothetical protein
MSILTTELYIKAIIKIENQSLILFVSRKSIKKTRKKSHSDISNSLLLFEVECFSLFMVLSSRANDDFVYCSGLKNDFYYCSLSSRKPLISS